MRGPDGHVYEFDEKGGLRIDGYWWADELSPPIAQPSGDAPSQLREACIVRAAADAIQKARVGEVAAKEAANAARGPMRSLRDEFAMATLVGLLSEPHPRSIAGAAFDVVSSVTALSGVTPAPTMIEDMPGLESRRLARAAYVMADAMLAERAKGEGT